MASDSSLFNEAPQDKADQNCEVCSFQGTTSPAVSYCTVCAEHLCKTCESAHRGSKLSRDHKILTGSELDSSPVTIPSSPPIMFCDVHKTMLMNVYCTTHDKALCGTCKVVSHGNCRTTDVKEQTFQMKADGTFNEAMDRLKSLKSEYENLKKLRNGDKELVKTKIKTCLHEVQLFREAINERLDELQKNISEDLRDIKKQMVGEIENHVTIADDALFQINNNITSMADCLKSKSNDVMFVGMKKANQQASEYANSLVNVQKEIYPVDIQFKASNVLDEMVQNHQLLGIILKGGTSPSPTTPSYPKTPILNRPILQEWKIDVGLRNVCGAAFMPNGHLVIACIGDGLKLLNHNFQIIGEFKIRALNVAPLNETDVIVSQGSDKQLLVVKLMPYIAVERVLQLDRICVGVDVHGREIYVTCHDNPGNGEVIVLSMEGQLLRKLGVDNGRFMFSAPSFVKVSMDGGKVFVSDSESHVVTCLDRNGHVMYRYTDQWLKYPVGLYVDIDENLLVCGQLSSNIHVVRKGGFKDTSISEKGSKNGYWCVARRESDGCVVVGMKSKSNKSLTVMRTQ